VKPQHEQNFTTEAPRRDGNFMHNKELATEIVLKLVRAGYKAYFAGGWVRDYLMDHPSDDIDIATDAPPQVILDLFPHTLLVGLSFGVVIVVMKGHQFEVSTFRRDVEYLNGRSPEKIELATPEEDALRRDFTINGMFYDPIEDKVYDYVHGMADIDLGIIKTIGDPFERFFEDRLRMVRAIRFAARFDFPIDINTQNAIQENASTLFPAVATERIWNEFNKMAKYPRFDHALAEMHRLQLLQVIFPQLLHVHLHDIRQYVSIFHKFPVNTPTILYIMALFPNTSMEELSDICTYLKISVQESKLAEFNFYARRFLTDEASKTDVERVRFYAHPQQQLCTDIFAAHLIEDQRIIFYKKHQENQTRLNNHIQRIIEKKPLVNAAALIAQGIKPGVKMGLLLKEAEENSIMNDLQSADAVLEDLKKSAHWSQ
jgi:poly(A) polymerase